MPLPIQIADQVAGDGNRQRPPGTFKCGDSVTGKVGFHFDQKGGHAVAALIKLRLGGKGHKRKQCCVAGIPWHAKRIPAFFPPGQQPALPVQKIAAPGGQCGFPYRLAASAGGIAGIGGNPEHPAQHNGKQHHQTSANTDQPPSAHGPTLFQKEYGQKRRAQTM